MNMNHPPEWHIQFMPGQGATGRAFKMNTATLTRRLSDKAGQWDKVHEMTPELKSIIHKDLKWIISVPLIPAGKFDSVGVLNIDGIADVKLDDLVLSSGAEVRDAIFEVANFLALQPSTCVNIDMTVTP
jgi:hypothetical protein